MTDHPLSPDERAHALEVARNLRERPPRHIWPPEEPDAMTVQDAHELANALLDAEERLRAPEIVSYEEMAARYAENIEACAGKLRASEDRREELETMLRRVTDDAEQNAMGRFMVSEDVICGAQEALEAT